MQQCFSARAWIGLASAIFATPAAAIADPAAPPKTALVEAALSNVMTLDRPGQDGYATVWDGNKYIQCRLALNGDLRCEAAGFLMQPSLELVLTPDKTRLLSTFGWLPDPSFGNYVRRFPSGTSPRDVANQIVKVLADVYDADPDKLEIESKWVASEPCPPRNGPTQNLAGVVDDAPSMASTAVHACAYTPTPGIGPNLPIQSSEGLTARYARRIAGEIQRLRINSSAEIYVIFDAGIGYVQCAPNTDPVAIYCEAQSAETWPALTSVLTPDRIAQLHTAGFADPGRAPNYWKTYTADKFTDEAIASELIAILHDVYGYTGAGELEITTEKPTTEVASTPTRSSLGAYSSRHKRRDSRP